MTDNDELSQAEKRAMLENDLRALKQQRAATLSDFAQAEAAEARGRFSTIEKTTVVGVSPPSYPKGPDWTVDPVGTEPPLGFDVNEMSPTGEPHEIAASITTQNVPSPEPVSGGQGNYGGSAAAPSNSSSRLMSKRVGPPPFSKKKR